MPGRYTEVHLNTNGPGDGRPTALQIIKDEGLEGKMADKVFVVTGASAGIGIETGRALAATGGRVFLSVRNMKKGEAACKSFLEPGRVELLEMDNNSFDSVRAAAKYFLSRSDKLNVLVNNAGIMASPYQKTVDGFESQFGVNHLSHLLFFNLVKDVILASSTPDFNSRVVCVSSTGHHASEAIWDDYNFEKTEYTPWKGYGQSKTANIYMANEIENRYGTKGLHGLSLHPGEIWTGLQKFMSADMLGEWKTKPGIELMVKSPEQGAATSVYASVGRIYEGHGRLYLKDCEPQDQQESEESYGQQGHSAWVMDKDKEKKLWDDSCKMIGLPSQGRQSRGSCMGWTSRLY